MFNKRFISILLSILMITSSLLFSNVRVEATGINGRVVGASGACNGKPRNNIKQIDLLSINAFHGRMESDESTVGAAKLASYINYYRNKNPKYTVVLDAGNALQGTALTTVTYGKPVVDFYNRISLDAMCVGNHEFDWGVKQLTDTMKFAKFPLVSANINENGKPASWTSPYVMLNKGGIKIGVIGLINPKHKDAIAAENMKDIEFVDAVNKANALIPEVKAKGADIVVILANIGGVTDPVTGVASGDLLDFAKQVKGADAIIGSLQDTVVTKVNGIPIVEAFRYGEKLGHIQLSYDLKNKKVVGSSVSLIDVINDNLKLSPDVNIQSMVDGYAKELNAINEVPIGTLDKDLVRTAGESEIGNWVVDSMRESAKTQIAFTNPGGIRADLKAGNITINNIYMVMPFPNTIVTGNMTGIQIKAFLEQCASVGPIPLSGIKFTYDSSKEVGKRLVTVTLSDGTPINDKDNYTVATNNFLAGGKDGYTTVADTEWTDTTVLIRDAMINNVKTNEGITAKIEGRIIDIGKSISMNYILKLVA